jgi:glyoxylase-like metal-dependent hydrolase (beta-lactamase superfamily II)
VTEQAALARVDVLAVGYADTPSVAGTVGLVRDGDCVIVVDPADGRQAFTHLWWRSDRTPEVDPYSTDQEELVRNRRRLLDGVDIVIPGHGSPFRVR